jgi:hypothetical protein
MDIKILLSIKKFLVGGEGEMIKKRYKQGCKISPIDN